MAYIDNIRKITILNIHYYSEDNKTVCELTYIHPFDLSPHVIKTTAKCHPDDEFDVKKGKHIAESRAKSILYNKYLHDLKRLKLIVDNLKIKYTYRKYYELTHIDKLIHNGKSM